MGQRRGRTPGKTNKISSAVGKATTAEFNSVSLPARCFWIVIWPKWKPTAIGEDRAGGQGTPGWSAPETEHDGPCKADQDAYSMGILLMTILCKEKFRESLMLCHSVRQGGGVYAGVKYVANESEIRGVYVIDFAKMNCCIGPSSSLSLNHSCCHQFPYYCSTFSVTKPLGTKLVLRCDRLTRRPLGRTRTKQSWRTCQSWTSTVTYPPTT